MDKFRFLKWKVYQDSQDLFSDILTITKKIPKEYRYEISSQVIRSAFSVVLNIAEGSGKESDKELNRYIEIALGSLYETLAATDTMRKNGFIENQSFENIFTKIDSISNQLGGFKKKLNCNRKSSVVSY